MSSANTIILATSLLIIASGSNAQEPAPARIHLKSGGEIAGLLINDAKKVDKKLHIVFQAEFGGMLQLESSMVSRVVPLETKTDAVYQKIYAAANDLDSHWKAVEWCRKSQGKDKTKYRDEINYHLRQILKFDPNDDEAWRGIKSPVTGKNVYRKRDGVWVNEVRRFKASGYIREDNKWMSEEALRIVAQITRADNSGDINKAVGKWKKLLRSKPAQASRSLSQIIGKDTVVPLFQFATGEQKKKNLPDINVRSMIVEAIGTIDSPQALNALVYFAIEDPDPNIRSRASTLLENTVHFPADNVVQTVLANDFLTAQSPLTIQRSAILLKRVDSVTAILPLIDALETKHVGATGERPGGLNTSARDGQIEGLQAGGGNATEEYFVRNEEVHLALLSLSRQTQDFGYNKSQWKDWYIRNFTHPQMDVRGDD